MTLAVIISDGPVFISILIGIVGVFGVVCALVAAKQVIREADHLRQIEEAFDATNDWEKVYKTKPEKWLLSKGIPADSHVGDQFRTVWGGWVARRLPTLGELHVLAVRRERSRSTTRVAGGIAAMLLVGGIAGTLWVVHPILSSFQISINPDGTQESSESAENVMGMIHSLGRAFWPSLSALLFTLLVAMCRGIYTHHASQLGRDLDRFAIDTLFPSFQPRTLGEDLMDVQVKMSAMVDQINERDEKFGSTVKSLSDLVSELKRNRAGLDEAVAKMTSSTEKLTKNAGSMSNSLGQHLGAKSPMLKAIKGFADFASDAGDAAKALDKTAKSVEDSTRKNSEMAADAARSLEEVVKTVPESIDSSCRESGVEMVKSVEALVDEAGEKAAGQIADATGPMISSMEDSKNSIVASMEDSKNSIVASMEDSKNSIETLSDTIHDSGVEVSNKITEAGKVAADAITLKTAAASENAAERIGAKTEESAAAIDASMKRLDVVIGDLASTEKETRAGFNETIEDLSSRLGEMVDTTSEKLTVVAEDIEKSEETITKVAKKLNAIPKDNIFVKSWKSLRVAADRAWQRLNLKSRM